MLSVPQFQITTMKEEASELNGILLSNKVQQMDTEVQKLAKMLQAKEAVLEDALCSINQLPTHPANTALIQNVLNARVKQLEHILDGLECRIGWNTLFQEYICIAIEVENDTHHNILPSCAVFCCNDLSDTAIAIFDGLGTSDHIPPQCRRRLLVSFQKGLLLSGKVVLVVDCETVNGLDSNLDVALLPLLPSCSRSKQTQIVKVFGTDEPLRKFVLAQVDDLSVKEGLELYQCLFVCYFSKLLSITPSRLRSIIRETGGFKETDFGDWQLFVGETDTVWNNFVVYVNSSFAQGSLTQCRLFSKNEDDMRHMARILVGNE